MLRNRRNNYPVPIKDVNWNRKYVSPNTSTKYKSDSIKISSDIMEQQKLFESNKEDLLRDMNSRKDNLTHEMKLGLDNTNITISQHSELLERIENKQDILMEQVSILTSSQHKVLSSQDRLEELSDKTRIEIELSKNQVMNGLSNIKKTLWSNCISKEDGSWYNLTISVSSYEIPIGKVIQCIIDLYNLLY